MHAQASLSVQTAADDDSDNEQYQTPNVAMFGNEYTSNQTNYVDDGTVLCNLDTVLEYTMDVLVDRFIEMEDKIRRYFKETDSNHDGEPLRRNVACCSDAS